MKKVLLILMGLLVVTACSGKTDWNVEMVDSSGIHANTPSDVVFKITSVDQAIANLTVNAKFEMAKMDHGSIEVELTEQEKGLYTGEVNLPMEGEWQAFLTISDEKNSAEEVVLFSVAKSNGQSSDNNVVDAVATINGETINEEDVKFYELINRIQIEMYREADQAKYKGSELEEAMRYWDYQEKAVNDRNTLLSQIIRLRAVALLAEEKGHKATTEEIEAKLDEAKKAYGDSPVAKEMINQYSEEDFWRIQERQQKLIVLSSKVQQDVLNNVKQANPDAQSNEVNMLAQKKYEELVVSQIGSLDIKIF